MLCYDHVKAYPVQPSTNETLLMLHMLPISAFAIHADVCRLTNLVGNVCSPRNGEDVQSCYVALP